MPYRLISSWTIVDNVHYFTKWFYQFRVLLAVYKEFQLVRIFVNT